MGPVSALDVAVVVIDSFVDGRPRDLNGAKAPLSNTNGERLPVVFSPNGG